MLKSNKKNRFGDNQYEESVDGTIMTPEGLIWTIKNPSNDIQSRYPDAIVRKYNDISYMLSKKALEVIPKSINNPYTGSACIMTVGGRSIILVADNKPYIQNCQGMRNEDEINPVVTMKRELKEELNISVTEDRFEEIGHWSFVNNIELIDAQISSKTILFHLTLSDDEISHITGEIDTFQIIDYFNDEVIFVVVVPFDQLDSISENINGKSFNAHHREALRKFLNHDAKYNIEYLKEFHVTSKF